MNQKKYQVFVSSTYEDLKKERGVVMQVLLEIDCIPSGMELFPAADEDQWSLIKGVIDDCDYYIVIIAGRYGSLDSEGFGYTEKEYRYAVKSGKPIIAFLHKNPGEISNDNSEQTDSGKKKLEEFRKLVKKRMCKTWSNPDELGSVVSRSLIQLRKKHPGVGWVRGDQVLQAGTVEKILQLQKEIKELENKLARSRIEAPPGTDNLAKGDDEFEIRVRVVYKDLFLERDGYKTMSLSWNEIFSTVAPLMIQEVEESAIKNALIARLKPNFPKSKKVNHDSMDRILRLHRLSIGGEVFCTIIVQLRALGLITKSVRQRSVKDTASYWTLTPYGDTIMNNLRAIRRLK